jgi:hypothetical protein
MTLQTSSPMTPAEAAAVLNSIGYRRDWTNEELIAATPKDMVDRVITALQVHAEAAFAEADALEAEGRQRRHLKSVPTTSN